MPVLKLNDFSGGLNTKHRQNRVADNESPALRNARWSLSGALSKRTGSTRNTINDGTADITPFSLYPYRLSGMSADRIIASDTRIATSNNSLSSWTNIATGVDNTNVMEFVTLADKVYMTNGVDTVRSYDGTTVSTIASYPKAFFHVTHKNYVFTLRTTANPSRLQWSDRGLPETWTTANFEDIYPNDSYYGTGLVSFGDELIIFKGPGLSGQGPSNETSMYRLLGDVFSATNPTYFLEKIPLREGVALHGNRSAKVYNGMLVFCTTDGFYGYVGGGREPQHISEILRTDIDYWDTAVLKANKPAAAVYRNRYYCSLGTVSALVNHTNIDNATNDRIYVLDGNKWFVDVISDTSDDMKAGGGAGQTWAKAFGNLYLGSGNSNVIRQYDTLPRDTIKTDNFDNGTSASVNFNFTTKEFDLEDEVLFADCYIHLKRQSSGILKFYTNINQNGEVLTSIDMTTKDAGNTETGTSNILRKKINIGRRGRTIQFRMQNQTNNDVEIYEIELHYARTQFTRDSYS